MQDFVNSWYATDAESPERDSFDFTMFYMQDDDTKVVIYEEISAGIYARPSLKPLDITLKSLSFEPAQSETAQEVSFSFLIEAKSSHTFDQSPYLLTQFADDLYKPVLSFERNPKVYVN